MKTGDKVYCLEEDLYGAYGIFQFGEIYTITKLSKKYYVISNVSFTPEEINKFFGTYKDYLRASRKFKIRKLNESNKSYI